RTLFPYTTLFRSLPAAWGAAPAGCDAASALNGLAACCVRSVETDPDGSAGLAQPAGPEDEAAPFFSDAEPAGSASLPLDGGSVVSFTGAISGEDAGASLREARSTRVSSAAAFGSASAAGASALPSAEPIPTVVSSR